MHRVYIAVRNHCRHRRIPVTASWAFE